MTNDSGRRPQHPGVILCGMLAREWVSYDRASEIIGVTRAELESFIAGDTGVTESLAQKLSGNFGSSAEVWHKLQSNYDNTGGR